MQEALCILGIHAFGKRRLWHKKVFEAGRKAKKIRTLYNSVKNSPGSPTKVSKFSSASDVFV